MIYFIKSASARRRRPPTLFVPTVSRLEGRGLLSVIAQSQALTSLHDQLYTGQLAAQDDDGGILIYALVTGTQYGSLGVNSDGTFWYAPPSSWVGTDSFTFTATDDMTGDSASGTITLVITDQGPTATDVTLILDPSSGPGTGDGVNMVTQDDVFNVTAEQDLGGSGAMSEPDGVPVTLTARVIAQPQSGTATIANNTISYVGNAGFAQSGTDSFTYVVNDGIMDSAPATVTVMLPQVSQGPNPAATEDISDPPTTPALSGTPAPASVSPPDGSTPTVVLALWTGYWAEATGIPLPLNQQVAYVANPTTPLQVFYNDLASWYNQGDTSYPFGGPIPWQGPPGGAPILNQVRQLVTPTQNQYMGSLDISLFYTGIVLCPFGPRWGGAGAVSGIYVREFWYGIEWDYYTLYTN
jgi:hypothetical protein